MGFATPADLLARSSARRLAQLAVPTDMVMPPESALRIAILGGSLAGFTTDEQTAITAALSVITGVLADADALLLSYGLPDTAQSTLLARLSSTVALYYLQGAERMTEDVRHAYEGVIDVLKAFQRGQVDLIPLAQQSASPANDVVTLISQPRRYDNQ
jgi:phage gp36-like protein